MTAYALISNHLKGIFHCKTITIEHFQSSLFVFLHENGFWGDQKRSLKSSVCGHRLSGVIPGYLHFVRLWLWMLVAIKKVLYCKKWLAKLAPCIQGNFACCFVICWFLLFFFFKKIFQEYIYSQCKTTWFQIRPDILSSLIWAQTVCKVSRR